MLFYIKIFLKMAKNSKITTDKNNYNGLKQHFDCNDFVIAILSQMSKNVHEMWKNIENCI